MLYNFVPLILIKYNYGLIVPNKVQLEINCTIVQNTFPLELACTAELYFSSTDLNILITLTSLGHSFSLIFKHTGLLFDIFYF